MTEPLVANGRHEVNVLRDADAKAWTDFVSRYPDANLYHTLLWRDFVQEVFGHRPIYVIARSGEGVTGVLPLFLVRHPVLGSKLISLPYETSSGGALVADETAQQVLAEKAIELARELRTLYLEIRCHSPRPVLEALGLRRAQPVLLSEMPLDGADAVRARISSDHRKAVRKASTRGITVREATDLVDFQAFYAVYLDVFRDFGTPPYGKEYFPTLWKRLAQPRAARLLLAEHQGRCVGGLMLFCWQKNLVSKFAACLPEAVPLRAYAALYWQAITLGIDEGYRQLSWGTSSRDQTGLIEFKERWGAQSRPVCVYSLPVRGNVPSLERYYDSNGWTRRLWRKLPLPATRWLGGPLNRWFC